MVYTDDWFANNPYVIQREEPQQQQQQINPMQMLDMYQQISGAGAGSGGATLGTASSGGLGATGLGSVMGSSLGGTAGAGTTAASGGMGSMGLGSVMGGGSGGIGGLGSSAVQGSSMGGSALGGGSAAGGGSSGAAGALASNPVGWIVAAALAQNVAHNKGISSWQAGLKGQAGMNIGDHYMKDKWGMEEDDPLYDAAGVLGWGSGGGIFNPGYLGKKIFGKVD